MARMLTALLLVALALPVAASAQPPGTNAPPGNSAIDEYLETIPGVSGDNSPRPPGPSGGVLTSAQRRTLERSGSDGRVLAALVEGTSPPGARGAAGQTQDHDVAPRSLAGGDARSPIGATLAAALGRDNGQGLGVLLPAIMLTGLLGFAGRLVLRRHRRAS